MDYHTFLAEIGQWERTGGGWDVGRMAMFIDRLLVSGKHTTNRLAQAESDLAAARAEVERRDAAEGLSGYRKLCEALKRADRAEAALATLQQAHAQIQGQLEACEKHLAIKEAVIQDLGQLAARLSHDR
jgi:hypothetical protein